MIINNILPYDDTDNWLKIGSYYNQTTLVLESNG